MTKAQKLMVFVEALKAGIDGPTAARMAGVSKASADVTASNWMRDTFVVTALTGGHPIAIPPCDDPKEFLARVMNHPMIDPKTRKDAAAALMPYVHKKIGEEGKKQERQKAAESVGSFSRGRAPLKLVGK